MSSDAELIISANSDGVAAGMRKASAAVQEGVEKINVQFEGFGKMFESLQGKFIAFSAILAGGAAFKEVIDETIKWTSEAVRLSTTLGITTQEASAMNMALDDLNSTALGFNVSSDTMTMAASKLTQRLAMNEQAFKDAGIATRDAGGHLRSTTDIMFDTNSYLMSLKEGTDRNTESAKLYGKGWVEVQGILGLTKERMDEATQKATELHLIVGPEGVAKTQAYKAALNDVDDIGKSLTVQFGNALLPVLTQTGKFMGEQGPEMATTFKTVLQSVSFVAGALWLTLKDMGDSIGALAAQAAAIMHGDFAMAKQIGAMRDEQARKNQDAFGNWKKSAFEELRVTSPGGSGGGANAPSPDGGSAKKGKSDMVGTWRSELEQQKEATGNFFKDTLSMEEEFWQSKLSKVKAGTKEYRAVEHELYQVHKQEATQGLANDLQDIRAQLADAKAGSEQRIQLANDVANRIGQSYGIESRQYKQALEDARKEARAWEAEQIKSMQAVRDANEKHSLEMLKIEEDELAQKLKMEQVSDQQAAQQLIQLKDQEYKIEVDALNAKLQLGDLEVGARQKINDQLLEMERKHALDIKKINDQSFTQEVASYTKMMSGVTNAFGTSINGMIMGTTTFQKAMANMGQSILGEFTKMAMSTLTKWLATELAKTSATTAGESARLAVTESAHAAGAAASATAGLAQVMGNAYKAASGAYAAIVGIPYVGPFLAPAAAAVAFAATAAFGSGISAEGGYDIPAGVNPLVQTHQREMILPSEHADTIRSLSANGAAAGGGDVHFHVNTMDAGGVKDFLKRNAHVMAPGLRSLARNFSPTKA